MRRSHVMFWRGSTTGGEIKSTNTIKDLKRIKICLKYKKEKDFDIKISRVIQSRIPNQIIKQWLKDNHIFGYEINENKFKSYCYYPDIPGNALSWGTLRRYLGGSLVFKPDSSRKLLYYKYMSPWQHFVPVRTDFSDLLEKYHWARKNPNEACLIAWEGYNYAYNYIRNVKKFFIEKALDRIEYL